MNCAKNYFQVSNELMNAATRLSNRELSAYGKANFKEPAPNESAESLSVMPEVKKVERPSKPVKLTRWGMKIVEKGRSKEA